MKRRQLIRFYLMSSLKKRLWMVILPAIVLGILTFILSSSLYISLPVTFLTALCTTMGILWSSYHRHQHEFPTDHTVDAPDPLV
jgi:intracellular septation protein A